MTSERHPTWTLPYDDRARLPGTSPLAAYLFRLMDTKKTNLCVSADVSTTRELLQLAEEVGDHICLFKTHADIIDDFGQRTTQGLLRIARKKGFLVFEDRKFGDIGSTVQKQYTSGPLQIVRWANIVNAHIFPGPAIVSALSSAAQDAVAAYSSTVETSISGPRQDDVEDIGSASSSDAGQSGETTENTLPDHSMFGVIDAEGSQDKSAATSALSRPNERPERKQSIVSVTTSISTRTENISNPYSQHKRDLSATELNDLSNAESLREESEDDFHPTIKSLGPPPFARGLLLLAEMSSADNLMDASYAQLALKYARSHRDFVMGFIAQHNLNSDAEDNFITMTPGVSIASEGDGLGQRYNDPEHVVGCGTDVVIVGRGILNAADRANACEQYRTRSWKAYEDRVKR